MTRECSLCWQTKPLDAFPLNAKCSGGRTRVCRDCTNSRARNWRRKEASTNPEFVEARRLSQEKARAKKYGVTLEWLAAHTACEICGRADSRLHVDHDHQTGEVRGMLCSQCNTGLGLFQDSLDRLTKAKEYLCKPKLR